MRDLWQTCTLIRGTSSDSKKQIAFVEHNPPQRVILSRLIEADYAVTAFENGEKLLASPQGFDAILLDIEMPGIDGYETCRQLRARGCAVPVLFVSAHDEAPERVAAYEAGGDDFITKPISAHELRHKLANILEQRDSLQHLDSRLHRLEEQSSTAQKIAFDAMSTVGDLGMIIEFLRSTSASNQYSDIVTRLIKVMTGWGLQGAVQVRGSDGMLEKTTRHGGSALQSAVLEKMRDMGRIFQFGSRAVINYDHVSLLIENLPTDDADKLDRIRDHLAVLADNADLRIAALDARNQRERRTQSMQEAVAELRLEMKRVSQTSLQNRLAGQTQILESLAQLTRTLSSLGLTDIQQDYIQDLIGETEDGARNFFDTANTIEGEIGEVLNRMEQLSRAN